MRHVPRAEDEQCLPLVRPNEKVTEKLQEEMREAGLDPDWVLKFVEVPMTYCMLTEEKMHPAYKEAVRIASERRLIPNIEADLKLGERIREIKNKEGFIKEIEEKNREREERKAGSESRG